MSQLNFYNSVSQLELDEQLNFIIHQKYPMLIKVNSNQYKTNILGKNSTNKLIISKTTNDVFSNNEVSCSFEVSSEQYFFQSFINSTNSEVLIDWPKELLKLQRRNDFRALVPMNFTYTCLLGYHNLQKINQKIILRDLSLGGFQLQTRLNTIKAGDRLELNIKILKLEAEKVLTEVRHVKLLNDKVTYQIGVKLLDVHADFLSDLQSVIVHLDRIHRGKSYD